MAVVGWWLVLVVEDLNESSKETNNFKKKMNNNFDTHFGKNCTKQ